MTDNADSPNADAIFCVGCGYDLRNLPVDGPCPECGRAIAESLDGRRLAAADTRWLTRLATGQTLVDRGLHLALISFGVMPLFAIAFGVLRYVNAPIGRFEILFPILLVLLLIGIGLVWFGAMLVTAPDPSERGEEPPHSARRLARWGLAVSIVCTLLAYLVTTLTVGVTFMFVARVVLQLLAVVGVTVGITTLLSCLAGRGIRIPDHDLARRTRRMARVLRWALPAFLIAMVIAVTPLQLIVRSPAIRTVDVIQAMFALTGMVVGCVVLFSLARVSTLMRHYSRAFRAARDEARQRHAGN